MLLKILPIYIFAASLIVFGGCNQSIPAEVADAYKMVPEKVDFNLHIRTILSDRCYSCHGPDDKARKANLRFDQEFTAKGPIPQSSGRAIVEGKLSKSKLVDRILSDDPEFIMPPPESNLILSAREKAYLVKWIEQGAEWKEHWAFIPLEKTTPPEVRQKEWVQNPIDNFVLARLESEGLSPSKKAGKERLLRRLSLDLRGIPPTIAEIDDFLEDNSAEAVDKVIDQMLASDDYAERMTLEWLDVARYADSHGLHADGWRNMWPWRDWVIKAFKINMPYDQFITEQLAGDLLPNATNDQILATAFHRNHPMTAEGGVVDEEFRLEYVFDRTNTTATAFMGLTMECARCHDHKFDPISQKEYYEMSAFFNNVKELGMTGDDGNYGPMLAIYDESTKNRLEKIKKSIALKEQELEQRGKEVANTIAFIEDLKTNRSKQARGLRVHYPLERIWEGKNKQGNLQKYVDEGQKGLVSGELEVVSGQIGKAIRFDDEYDMLHLYGAGLNEWTEAYTAGAWINTHKHDPEKTQVVMGTAGEKNNFWRGWDLFLDEQNRPSVRLIHSLPHNYIQITANESIPVNQWKHLYFTYDGSGKAKGLRIFVDGQLAESTIKFDQLYKSIKTVSNGAHRPIDRPVQVARSYRAFTGEIGVFDGEIDDIRIYDRQLTSLEVAQLAGASVEKIFAKNPSELAPKERQQLLEQYLHTKDPMVRNLKEELKQLRQEQLTLLDPVEEVMVMEEMPLPRPTYVLNRGQYDAPKEQVYAGTPEKVLPFPENLPKNRLGLARWLTSKDHPLTARVAVNRYWQLFFGQGLVKTPQDFGSQGTLPTHLELLDWLAIHFMESAWDIKALHKLILSSATYQQASIENPKLTKRDPYNDLMARGPKHRLSAELIRDNMLAASGLLVKKVGGASVRPYQPEGLWIDKGTFSYKLLRYKVSRGDSLYRKSMYTFIKRTSPHPAMIAFDAPSREVCTVQRENTNTPLQALVLMNDPQFVECARVLAQRIQKEAGEELSDQLFLAFRLLTSRRPQAKELELFSQLYDEQLAIFQSNPHKAASLLEIGEFPLDQNLDKNKTAALTVVASTMINHDEAYMKR